jgi:hypothetical protein
MITSNMRYPFGRKLAMVETPSFNCMIKTAKNGLFGKQSTSFSVFGSGVAPRRQVATLQFDDHLDSDERLRLHDIIAGLLDEAGMSGKSLDEALRELFEELEGKNIGQGRMQDL